MKLTVLGCDAAAPRAGGACSGYLVEHGETRILVDCGNGVFAKLSAVADYRSITAILISHWHADHWFDLVPYRYAVKYGLKPVHRPPTLYLPPGGLAVLSGATRAFDASDDFFAAVFPSVEYEPDRALLIGPFEITFARTRHVVPTFAMRFSGNGQALVYSSDTGPSLAVEALARDARLFLCEATLQGQGDPLQAVHCSARQAGEMAAKARVDKLLLTHLWPELDPELSLAQAGEVFGNVAVAENLRSYEV